MIDFHSARTWEILRGIEKGFSPKDYPFSLTQEELNFFQTEKNRHERLKKEMIAEGRDPSILHFVPANDE